MCMFVLALCLRSIEKYRNIEIWHRYITVKKFHEKIGRKLSTISRLID